MLKNKKETWYTKDLVSKWKQSFFKLYFCETLNMTPCLFDNKPDNTVTIYLNVFRKQKNTKLKSDVRKVRQISLVVFGFSLHYLGTCGVFVGFLLFLL